MSGRSQRTNGKGQRAGLKRKQSGALFQKPRLRHPRGGKGRRVYLKVKTLLTTEGEVSDAIGRLTDREYYNSLSYEEKLKEFVGHTPLQVLAGALLGILIAVIYCFALG